MKFFNRISNYFYLSVILCLGILLLLEKCGKGKPTISEKVNKSFNILEEQKRIRDSAYNAQVVRDKQHKSDSAKWKKVVDSTAAVLSSTKKQLNKSQAENADLVSDVESAYERKDSAQFVIKCLQLKDSVKILNAMVDQFEYQVDTLMKAKDSLQAVTQKRLEERDDLIRQLRISEGKTDSTISGLRSDLKRVLKRADKKYTIGIGGGAGITTEGKPSGLIGITISRTVIRL